MDDLIDFVRTQLGQEELDAVTTRDTREVEFKWAVFGLHMPRYDGYTWVCDGCSGYDVLRRTPVRIYAPCNQLEALVRVYEDRPGFDPGWAPEDSE